LREVRRRGRLCFRLYLGFIASKGLCVMCQTWDEAVISIVLPSCTTPHEGFRSTYWQCGCASSHCMCVCGVCVRAGMRLFFLSTSVLQCLYCFSQRITCTPFVSGSFVGNGERSMMKLCMFGSTRCVTSVLLAFFVC
jgi:hypothetical protein